MSNFPAVDKKTRNWIRREIKCLQAQEDYSPVIPDVDNLVESWSVNNPKMFKRLNRAKLLRPFAEVMLAKQAEERDALLASGYPPTDAREQAEQSWYLEPEEQPQSQEDKEYWEAMRELDELLQGKARQQPTTIYL